MKIFLPERKKQGFRETIVPQKPPYIRQYIAQETFVQCLLHIRDLQEAERFRAWFFKTLTRCAWKTMDKKRRLLPMEWCDFPYGKPVEIIEHNCRSLLSAQSVYGAV